MHQTSFAGIGVRLLANLNGRGFAGEVPPPEVAVENQCRLVYHTVLVEAVAMAGGGTGKKRPLLLEEKSGVGKGVWYRLLRLG